MRKLIKRVILCGTAAAVLGTVGLLRDRHTLRDGLIRFHVVANSDTEHDQSTKLQVRDAVLSSLQNDMEAIADVETAKAYLQENLPKIERIANETLTALGVDGRAAVSLCKETFQTRYYDTFCLPAGVYESLRIVIGEGGGHNWWCVAFPTLCLPATSEGFEEVAAGAGFSESLCDTLTGKETYTLRFFVLDALGALENLFFSE